MIACPALSGSWRYHLVDSDTKERLGSFKVTPSNNRALCVYVPSVHITREQLAKGRFFERTQIYTENKNDKDEKKIEINDNYRARTILNY